MEFVVHRHDEPSPNSIPTGRKYTSCRLLLSRAGFLDLANKIDRVVKTMLERGEIRRITPPSPTSKSN